MLINCLFFFSTLILKKPFGSCIMPKTSPSFFKAVPVLIRVMTQLEIFKKALEFRSIEWLLDRSTPEPNTGCWLWLLGLSEKGYGVASISSRMPIRAHRLSYMLHYGSRIPEGGLVCHHCDTPSCINPSHLYVAGYFKNYIDMIRKGRASWQVDPEAYVQSGKI